MLCLSSLPLQDSPSQWAGSTRSLHLQFVFIIVTANIREGRIYLTWCFSQIFRAVLMHEEMLQYVRKACQAKSSPAVANPFTKFENLLQFYLLSMGRLVVSAMLSPPLDITSLIFLDMCLQDGVDLQIYHRLSLSLLTRLHQGDEAIAHDLLSNVVFNHHYMWVPTGNGNFCSNNAWEYLNM